MMKQIVIQIALTSFTMSTTGCCSIFCGGSQMITVNSKPEGAKVEMGSLKGITPYQVKIAKGRDDAIRVSYAGETQATPLERKIDGVFWINIFFWPGLIIDAATGNMHKYDPTVYDFNFTQGPSGNPAIPTSSPDSPGTPQS